jgi:murein DD-endopeptidase MepM/ murein hydrolase activator NlpD
MIEAIFPSRRADDEEGEAVVLELRGRDGYGSGAYGAPRGDRTHRGIDFKAPAGAAILSPVSGEVSKLGYPYSDDFSYRYVEVTTRSGLKHRLFYVDPMVKVGDKIAVGQPLGLAQHIAARYDEHLMNNHIHYEVMLRNKHINPTSL